MKDLINRLNNEPEIENVYFNDNGGWLLVPNVQHPHKRSREEVLQHWEDSPELHEGEHTLTQTEDDPYEQIKLLEEENELLKKQLEYYEDDQTRLQENQKTISELSSKNDDLQKSLTASEKKIKKLSEKPENNATA